MNLPSCCGTVALTFALLVGCPQGQTLTPPRREGGSPPSPATQAQQWTCPMHPEVVRDAPGKCPICGMDLVPKTAP